MAVGIKTERCGGTALAWPRERLAASGGTLEAPSEGFFVEPR